MKKSLQLVLILLVIFLASNVVVSAPVSVETAKTVAANFVRSMGSGDPSSLSLTYKGENIYVFDDCRSFRMPSLGSGWVIVSADDRAYPILGYSNEGWFLDQADTIVANNFWTWMKQIEDEISYAIENNLSASAEISQMWQELKENCFVPSDGTTAVEPLVTTTWGQGFPYNAMCPAGAVTGCVATAMGQILKYWNYPEQGLGSYGYTWEGYPYTYADFGATTYNWANMPNSISEPNDDVATLLYHTAVSCRSMWGSNTGVGYSSDQDPMTRSFINYFKMAYSSIQYIQKNQMPTTWESTIQAELTAGRPVYYRGDGVGSHAWVCDGVDQNNLYHFNWGWNGMYNGYFALTAIMPGNYNFTNNQSAIIGIQPNDGSTLVENTNWSGSITKTTSIAIPDAITLSINPGTEVKFAQGAKLQAFGRIIAIGNQENYVNFTAIDTINGWEGIKFDNGYMSGEVMADNDTSMFIYSQIQWSNSSGIYTYQYGKIIVDHCKVNNNDAGNGAGVAVWLSSVNISNSEIYNNHATVRGGGIFVATDNVATSIYQNNIYDNVSDIDGGGVYLSNLNYTVFENNVVHHNQAVKGAGAMLTSGSPMIVNNKFCNNDASSSGGGLYLESCNAYIVSNLISNNSSGTATSGAGGGISIFSISSPQIINNTIVNNNSNKGGGMVFATNSNANIKNCIIYANYAINFGNQIAINTEDSDPYFDHCNIEGGMEGFGGPGSGTNYNSANYTNNIDADPLFVDPSGGAGSGYNGLEADWSLQMQSACIDAGDTTGVSQYLPPFDLGGNLRINGTIDMGAYEYCGPQPAGTISGNANHPCQSSIENYSVINVPGISYFWEVPAGWVINSGQGSNAIIVTVGSTSDTITVTPSNNCGNGSPGILAVTVSPLPAEPSAILGADNPCESSTQSYSVISVPEISYLWEVPAGWVINSGQGSSAINVTVGSTSGNITVTPSNTCGNGTAGLLAVVVSPLPVQPSQPAGPVEVDIYYNPTSIYTTEASNADSFAWELTPQEFGTLNGNGASATITWSGLLGPASLTVKSENECGESEWSEPLIIQVDNSVGVEETLQGQITISPNPANGFIHFSGLTEGLKVSLLSLSGQMLMSGFVDANKRLDVSHIPAGMYFVKIEYKQAVRFEKVVLK